MKRFLLNLTIGGAFLLFLGAGSAWGATVQHTFAAASGDIDSNISFTTQQNSASSAPSFNVSLRLYAYRQSGDGNSITLTAKNGVIITEVIITANAAANTPPTSYYIDGATTGTSISWNSVTGTISSITASSSLKIQNRQYAPENGGATTQLHIKSIEVTYIEPLCTDPGLSFGITDGIVYKKTDAANFTQIATSSSAGTITYDSSEPTVATVNSSTGNITVMGKGITTITATQVANLTYCLDEAEYTLVVGDEFQLVTSESQLIPDGEYIAVGKKSATEYTALGKQTNNNRTAIPIYVSSDASSIITPIATVSTDEDNIYKLKLSGSVGVWVLTDIANSTIIGPVPSGENNRLLANASAKWTISIAGDSKVTITCTGSGANNDGRNVIKYNSSSSIFACYQSTYTAGIGELYLYATPETIQSATSIASKQVDKTAVSVSYYDLTGKSASADTKGFVIQKTVYSDGSISNSKTIVK